MSNTLIWMAAFGALAVCAVCWAIVRINRDEDMAALHEQQMRACYSRDEE